MKISELKRLATLGQLAAGVAHEINNPLGGIVVYSHLLLEDTSLDDPRRPNIEKIVREADRCRIIVKGLLDFTRQNSPELKSTDVITIIKEALNNICREPEFDNITIIEKFENGIPYVMVDASQIQEVFENIIRNAAEVMKGSGELIISSRLFSKNGHKMVEILFEDTGPGIPLESIDHVFDPFFTTKGGGHGTGLGLTVSYGIVDRHGGTITIRNRDEGGAVFSVQLPVGEEE
ncbi:MAG: hypothetical protein JXB48_19705 [Candidatus Latescibacteria bacterium]|nr:hypothetical protein [Candidatus Latescibacterota bacterium]